MFDRCSRFSSDQKISGSFLALDPTAAKIAVNFEIGSARGADWIAASYDFLK
jgi:hypothetical protein